MRSLSNSKDNSFLLLDIPQKIFNRFGIKFSTAFLYILSHTITNELGEKQIHAIKCAVNKVVNGIEMVSSNDHITALSLSLS